MRTFILAIFLCLFDFADAQTNYVPSYYIPAVGRTEPSINYIPNGTTYSVGTNGAVNLGSNSYSLTYASLPTPMITWYVIFDATQLTGTNVNLFGETPLTTYPGTKSFLIRFDVVWSGTGTAKKVVTYAPSLDALYNINITPKFNSGIKVYGSSQYQPGGAIVAGSVVKATDDSGHLAYGCVPWCTSGNAGLGGTNSFVGTLDTADLNIRVNNVPAGNISVSTYNAAYGLLTLTHNTSGIGNTAMGTTALELTTTGTNNTGIGNAALLDNTTGSYNTALGVNCASGITTGDYNTAIGNGALGTIQTGIYNTAIGVNINQSSSSVSYGVGIGANATFSSHQLAISPNVENLHWAGHPTGINYVLADSSGAGDFIPSPLFSNTGTTLTPITGDSVTLVYGKTTINPGSTLANLTLIMPGAPNAYQTYIISFQQVITALHISTRLSGGNAPNLPANETQGSSLGVYWDPNLSEWVAASH